MNTHHIQVVDGKTVEASQELINFQLFKKPSSNVDFFGINYAEEKLFVQFIHGGSYLHQHMDSDLLQGCESAESIGSYYSKYIRNKGGAVKVEWTVKEVK